ncbi:hypothetical protein LTR50_007808 [Elasticomyces elasticus]|nr:hypothetical protein LTR50_007808 [Elasticomyces elasticus]
MCCTRLVAHQAGDKHPEGDDGDDEEDTSWVQSPSSSNMQSSNVIDTPDSLTPDSSNPVNTGYEMDANFVEPSVPQTVSREQEQQAIRRKKVLERQRQEVLARHIKGRDAFMANSTKPASAVLVGPKGTKDKGPRGPLKPRADDKKTKTGSEFRMTRLTHSHFNLVKWRSEGMEWDEMADRFAKETGRKLALRSIRELHRIAQRADGEGLSQLLTAEGGERRSILYPRVGTAQAEALGVVPKPPRRTTNAKSTRPKVTREEQDRFHHPGRNVDTSVVSNGVPEREQHANGSVTLHEYAQRAIRPINHHDHGQSFGSPYPSRSVKITPMRDARSRSPHMILEDSPSQQDLEFDLEDGPADYQDPFRQKEITKHKKPPLSRHTDDQPAYSQPGARSTTGGKTLAPAVIQAWDQDMARAKISETDDKTSERDASPVLAEDYVHYRYRVLYKSYISEDDPNAIEWTTWGYQEYASKAKAQAAACEAAYNTVRDENHPMLKEGWDLHHEAAENGTFAYTVSSEFSDRKVSTKVQRYLHQYKDRVEPDSKEGWLPKHCWAVKEKTIKKRKPRVDDRTVNGDPKRRAEDIASDLEATKLTSDTEGPNVRSATEAVTSGDPTAVADPDEEDERTDNILATLDIGGITFDLDQANRRAKERCKILLKQEGWSRIDDILALDAECAAKTENGEAFCPEYTRDEGETEKVVTVWVEQRTVDGPRNV